MPVLPTTAYAQAEVAGIAAGLFTARANGIGNGAVCGIARRAVHAAKHYSSTTSVMVNPREAFCTKPCTVSV